MSIQWLTCTSRVTFSFWQVLRGKIIEEWKLDNSKKSICGFVYQTSDSCILEVRGESFDSRDGIGGDIILCNTAHEFKTRDKQALLAETSAHFCMLIYPNIKDNVFLYWFGFPANVLRCKDGSVRDMYAWRVLDFKQSAAASALAGILCPFPVWSKGNSYTLPWFARRTLRCLCAAATGTEIVLICSNNITITIRVAPVIVEGAEPAVIGWESDQSGRMCPRRADLRGAFDPAATADQAARLNLELMRWRMLPSLDLAGIDALKCLILGAGTLGCHIARDLLAWGVRHITFVDSGRVAYSNPVRQPLFEFNDAVNERWKAQAAVATLKRIHPTVVAEGHVIRIPLPGHPVHDAERGEVERDIDTLTRLIAEHDVVFLGTDTRESRWLPALLARAAGKHAFTVALGFDTWLVMRHSPTGNGGCYFCLDCVAPANTTLNRTLDQQCTVTRPGVAPLASATAVELLMSLLHHPRRFEAPADHDTEVTAATASPLGIVPQIIRGFSSHMRTMTSAAECSNYCSACSTAVQKAFIENGKNFLFNVFSDNTILEKTVGLDVLDLNIDDM
jgi:molybdopterin/thiamine biosynthesis adenylyltransferase